VWKAQATRFTRSMGVTGFTDNKVIIQNVRLLGCVNKTCDNCCCSSRLAAPAKKNLEREKRHNAVCDIAALNTQ